jgi:hypothetical protein
MTALKNPSLRSSLFAAAVLAGSWTVSSTHAADFPEDALGWPAVSSTNKPWTRWWWLGSAVDKPNVTRELEEFAKVGIGGVEICPIYGAVGAEDRALDFLSPGWMEMLAHTSTETKRLGLGLDMTTGTGWPFGGPQVDSKIASAGLKVVREAAKGGEAVSIKLPEGSLQCLRAWPEDGPPVDLSSEVKDGILRWLPPAGNWQIFGLVSNAPIQQVKRSAPGGQGNVLDPFSTSAMTRYLAAFDAAFEKFAAPMPRAQFHDSFEYYAAAWTPDLLEIFRSRRGYDLRDQLPAFAGTGDAETVTRVRSDYRETLNELHLAYLQQWHDWTKARGGVTRNQAHGSPGNLLDHYAVSEIPETEIFRHVGFDQIPMLRIAASAAHSNGNTLVSAETFTWLDEHFQVTPEQLKEAADFVFLGGVNHIFFHGIPYSPDDAQWPGWLFYASTHMGKNGGLWRDLSAFTGYLQRCQSILQEGRASSDVLLYFPIHDLWSKPGKDTLPLFTIHNQADWLHTTPFYRSSMELWENGITFDYASDAMLSRATVSNGKIVLGGHEFAALVLPGVKHLTPATLERIIALTRDGVKLIVQDGWPAEVPGLHEREERRRILLELQAAASEAIPVTGSLLPKLAELDVRRETMSSKGLRFIRRSHSEGYHYFIVNDGKERFDGVLPLAVPFQSAAILDPWNPTASRVAAATAAGVSLQLAPGQSTIIRTFNERKIEGTPWTATPREPKEISITGPWELQFIEGGPELPEPAEISSLACWTSSSAAAANFSGTARYTSTFEIPTPAPASCQLDLGKVANTARVSVNGKFIGISWTSPHLIDIGAALKPGTNLLEIEVTNLAANRIADLDRRKIEWKKFHEINFVNIDYKLFDASEWPAQASGLLGPVRLLLPPEK